MIIYKESKSKSSFKGFHLINATFSNEHSYDVKGLLTTCTIKSIFDSESKGLFLGNLRQDKKDNGRKRYAMIQR